MSLPIQKPQGGTPTSADFISLQTLWARALNPIISAFNAGDGIPVGTIWMWATSVAPTNFLVCNATTVLQQTYPQLFSVIGTSFNTGGEPPGSFRLPAASGSFTLIIKALP